MKHVKIEISGNELNKNEILLLLREIANPKIEKTEGDLHLFFGQEYSFASNSDVMVSVIFKFETEKSTIEIISGGGGDGIFGFTFGSEKSTISDLVKGIEKFCTKNELEFNTQEIDV